jgi:hypothetical protein
MLTVLIICVIGTLAGVAYGYRLGTQRVIHYEVSDDDTLPAPMSPYRLAEEWRYNHERGGKPDGVRR